MDRELVLLVLLLALSGGAHMLVELGRWWWARWRGRRGRRGAAAAGGDEPAEAQERRTWRHLWGALLPGGVVLAFLIGWALQEPQVAEALPLVAFAAALPFAVLWTRAGVRAARSALGASSAGAAARHRAPLAATIGLLRPRVVLAPQVREQLDAAALRAVTAHEEAHARHRDPLRLWMAQLATDLQWPLPSARRRFLAWRVALELARDDEAVARGVDGGDLAAGLLAVARLGARVGEGGRGTRRAGSASRAAGEVMMAGLGAELASRAFRQRVTRLIEGAGRPPLARRASAGRCGGASCRALWGRAAALTLAGAALIALGYVHGELVVASLIGLGV